MTIQEAVADKIKTSGPKVTAIVVENLVHIEVSKRVDLITKGLTKLSTLEKEFNKINGKMDTVFYDTLGVKQESMSSKRFDEIKKAKDQLDNFKKVINDALELNTDDSYTKLNGQLGGNKDSSKPEVITES